VRERILMDTGPIVAGLNRRDRFHAWARDSLAEINAPMLTCEAVLAEACFLLRGREGGSTAVLELVERGVLQVAFRVDSHVQSLGAMVRKYANVPMSLADACLVRMTELHEHCAVMTLDTDFLVYRRHGRQVIPVLMPPGLARARR